MTIFVLRGFFTDDCTYTSEVFCGVFSSEEKAEKGKKAWVREHKETPDDWRIHEATLDEVF